MKTTRRVSLGKEISRLVSSLVGSLVYLTVTCPNISYAIHQVSQYLSAPRSTHYAAILRILRYLKGIILLLLYVDDMIITSDDLNGIQELKNFLSQQFEIKDLGHLSYFFGLEITHSIDGLYITQAKYASELFSRAGLTDSKTVDTPVKLNVHLTPSGGKPLSNPSLYRCLVGSLVYLIVTRLDISYVVHQVSQYLSTPRLTHYAAVLRILRYLKGTIFHGLFYSA